MNIERLKMWRDALVEAGEKGRHFDFSRWRRESSQSPCGFTACLAGDLALYKPAQDLGLGFDQDLDGDGDDVVYVQSGFAEFGADAIRAFLEAYGQDDDWVWNTIMPDRSEIAYNKPAAAVTRADGLARIIKMIAEREAEIAADSAEDETC